MDGLDATRGDATLLSVPSRDGKRPRAANAEPDQPPNKKRRQHDGREPFDLDQLTLTCKTNGELFTAALNALAEPALTHGELRNAHHYQYDKFREWLSQTSNIPRDRAMSVILLNMDGEHRIYSVKDKWSFTSLLGNIKNKVLTVPSCADYGYILKFEPLPEEATAKLLEQAPPVALPVAPPTEDAIADDAQDEVEQERNIPPPPRNRLPESAPQPVIDLTASEDEEDAPMATDDVEGPSGTTCLTSFDEAMFKKALHFFQVDEEASHKYKIRGIARPVHMYQLYAAYGLLMSPITSGVNGAMVGWDVGFGKTMLMLLYLRIRAKLALLWKEVNADWKNNTTIYYKHLPERNQPFGAGCPSQGKFVIECPCVASSDSRRICTTYLTDSPAVIVIPPGLVHGWLSEARAVYRDQKEKENGNGNGNGDTFITFYTYVAGVRHPTSLRNNSSKERWEAVVTNTSGQVVDIDMFDEDNNKEYKGQFVTCGKGNATDVFLVSSRSVKMLQGKYPKAKGTDTTCFTAGVMIMDEHQQYKGSTETSDTIPFTVLREISNAAEHPVTLFTLCGTTLEEGPSAWRAPIKHFEDQWQMFADNKKLQCENEGAYAATLANFTTVRRQYLGLIRLLASKDKTIAELGREIDMLVTFFKPIMWSLRQDQLYRGVRINPLPPCREDCQLLDPDMDSCTGTAFKSLVTGVQTLVKEKLKIMVIQWEATDKAEPKPTMSSLIEDLASGQQKTSDTSFTNLQRASMYPHLAVLQGFLAAEAFTADVCQAAAETCQKQIFQGVPRDKAIKALHTWDFTGHLDALQKNSAKFSYIKKLIYEMVCDQDKQTIPSDGSGKRHAILFHSQPISAVLTYILLLRDPDLRTVVQPLLLCSKSNNEERAEIVKQMNEKCTPQRPNKVLITLTSIAAEGFNIQRANNIWFTELPVTLSKKEQAKGRAHRQGQTMKVNIVKLVEKGNLMEEFGYDAMKAKETIAKLVYGVYHME